MRIAYIGLSLGVMTACATDGPADTSNGLYINAALGVTLTQSPLAMGVNREAAVEALVLVTRDNAQGEDADAILTVNGALVPKSILGYDVSNVAVVAGAGESLHLHATEGTDSADLTLPCPAEVTLTAPADNSDAAVGAMIDVTWTGSIDHATSVKPDIMVHGFDPATGTRSKLDFPDRVVAGRSSDSFMLPDPKTAPQWLVDLYVPGDLIDHSGGVGFCMLDRRAHLVRR